MNKLQKTQVLSNNFGEINNRVGQHQDLQAIQSPHPLGQLLIGALQIVALVSAAYAVERTLDNAMRYADGRRLLTSSY